MKMKRILCRANVGMLMVVLSTPFAHASNESAEGAKDVTGIEGIASADSSPLENPRLARLLKEASLSPGVNEVAQMAESGVGDSVLMAQAQNSDKLLKLRPDDIVHLRNHDVPDLVVAAMIERGAELRARRALTPPPHQPVQVLLPKPATVVTVVALRPQPRSTPASTLTIIGRSGSRRGLSYRNFYDTRRSHFTTRPYRGVYTSYGNYSHRYRASYRGSLGCRVYP